MCDPVSLTLTAIGVGSGMLLSNHKNNKEKAKANAQIKAANQAAADQAEANKVANSLQTTTPMEEQDLKQKLAAQKVPLNPTNTGLAVGNGLSTGLNLGGY